jgi:hypothetical protein
MVTTAELNCGLRSLLLGEEVTNATMTFEAIIAM